MRLNKNNQGFSLMELLVVMAIFAVTITLALDIFMTITVLEKRTIRQQELENNSQLLLDAFMINIESAQIDYDFYEEYLAQSSEDELAKEYTHIFAFKQIFAKTVIRLSGDALDPWSGSGNNIEICSAMIEGNCLEPTSNWQTFSYDNLSVADARFYLQPRTDYMERNANGVFIENHQSMFTFFMKSEAPGSRSGEILSLEIQTSLSLKNYQR